LVAKKEGKGSGLTQDPAVDYVRLDEKEIRVDHPGAIAERHRSLLIPPSGIVRGNTKWPRNKWNKSARNAFKKANQGHPEKKITYLNQMGDGPCRQILGEN